MSVSGLCEECGTGEVTDACDRCGRLVCERHYDEETGLCTDCASETGGIPAPERQREPDVPDEGDTYRF